jgi:hypothetical protein
MTLKVTIEVWKRIAMHFAEKELLYRWNESPKIQREEDRVVFVALHFEFMSFYIHIPRQVKK